MQDPELREQKMDMELEEKIDWRKSEAKRSTYLAIGVKTRVDDAVHVEVHVVELHAVGIRFRDIDMKRWRCAAVEGGGGLFLDDIGDGEGIAVREPPIKRWDSHSSGSVRPGSGRERERERK